MTRAGIPVVIPTGLIVREHTYTLARTLGPLVEMIERANANWAGLQDCYDTPEATHVYAALHAPTDGVADLKSVLETAVAALLTFTDTITEMNAERAEIMSDTRDLDVLDGDAVTELDERVRDFDDRFEEADAACAAVLDGLRVIVEAPFTEVLEGLDDDNAAAARDLLLGHLEQLAETPVQGAPTEVTIFTTRVTFVDLVATEVIDGVPYTRTPSGLLVPTTSLTGGLLMPSRGVIVSSQVYTAVIPGAMHLPPAWMRRVSRVLNFLGGGVTVYGAYADHYNSLLLSDPTMSDWDRILQSLAYAGVVGGSEVVGGIVYAALVGVGLSVAATPFVGVPLGVAAGWAGSEAGNDFGEWLWDLVA